MMLSKSKYIRGNQCPKSLWLYVHKKEEQKISPQQETIFSRGSDIGTMARNFFEHGKLAVPPDEYPSLQTAQKTQELIQKETIIYEATFIAENTIVAIDILKKNRKGKWDIYEVKSSNSLKLQHVVDVAVQYTIAQVAGMDMGEAFGLHLNRDYVRRGDIDIQQLFVPTNCTQEVLDKQDEIKTNIPQFLKLMAQKKEPKKEMGNHCENPYYCDFYTYCESLELENFEILEIEKDIPPNPRIVKANIRQFVKEITYPIAYLDFETIMPVVPMWNESRPYQQIPFQYSIHLQKQKNAPIIHYEYLAPSDKNIDPRLELLKNMIAITKEAKTIFVYNEKFERKRIEEMMRDFPTYEKKLQNILDKIVDLAQMFRGEKKGYIFNCLGRQWGLKKILPLLCPDLSYQDLEIADGNTASQIFYELYHCPDPDHIQTQRNHLIEYCKMDTWAMVGIWEKLTKI